jgi:hypothetical protein
MDDRPWRPSRLCEMTRHSVVSLAKAQRSPREMNWERDFVNNCTAGQASSGTGNVKQTLTENYVEVVFALVC